MVNCSPSPAVTRTDLADRPGQKTWPKDLAGLRDGRLRAMLRAGACRFRRLCELRGQIQVAKSAGSPLSRRGGAEPLECGGADAALACTGLSIVPRSGFAK